MASGLDSRCRRRRSACYRSMRGAKLNQTIQEPVWLRGCLWLSVLLFVLVWPTIGEEHQLHGQRTSLLTCTCICKLIPDQEFECDRGHLCEGVSNDSRTRAKCPSHEIVMRCPSVPSATGGTFVIRPQEVHASAFVRVSGPVVNTIFFQKTWWQPGDCQVWAAPYMVDCCDCMSRLTTGGSLDQNARKLVTNRKTALRGLVPLRE